MAKVSTDPILVEEFLTRGVEQIYPGREELRQKLLSGERIVAYQGFDPTGKYLHVGHAIGIRGLRILQKLGHEVIFLIGDYTAKVGDPDKDTARAILSDETISQNMEGWKEQASQLIDFEGENPVLFKRNFEWLSELKLKNLINLMSKTTVQQMMERELFQKRIAKGDPIGLQEFIYPLMQAYDSVAMHVDLEIGGTDQTFNMLMGRNLVRQYLGKEKYVRTNIMMEAPDGITMSKTKGNGINLSDSGPEMYGKAMSYPDELIVKGLNLMTEMPLKDILEIEKQINDGENPMKFKKIMAYEIVKTIKGTIEAQAAQDHFERTVQKKEIAESDMETVYIAGELTFLDLLKQAVPGQSASQIRRVVEQGGAELDNIQIKDPNKVVKITSGMMIKFGKRNFYKIG